MCSTPDATCTTKLQAIAEKESEKEMNKERESGLRYVHSTHTSRKAHAVYEVDATPTISAQLEATRIQASLELTAYASKMSGGDSRSYSGSIQNDGIVARR